MSPRVYSVILCRLNNDLQRYPGLIPRICKCCHVWQERLCCGLRFRLLMGDYLGLSSWALNAVTSVLIRGRQRELWHRGEGMWPLKQDALWLAFEMEEEALGQGMQRIQFLKLKKARNGFSPRTSKGSPALPTPCFWPSEADFRLLAHQVHCINNLLRQS